MGAALIDRYLKIMVCVIIALMVLMYDAHNIASLEQAHAFFVFATSHQGQEAYPVTLLPVPASPLVYTATILVIGLELLGGTVLLIGALRMWSRRSEIAPAFEKAKALAKVGFGCAILVWWGLFQGIAVAGYQLWQMPGGEGPNTGSWIYGAMTMMSLIYVSLREDVLETSLKSRTS